MKNQNISKSDIYVKEANIDVYEAYEASRESQKLYVVSIDNELLKTPKGKSIASPNEQAMRELAAELDYSDELVIERISLYNLLCTQLDFPVDLDGHISFDAMTIFLLNDPVLRTCAGPEAVDQLKYFHTVINYLERFELPYPSLPQIEFTDATDPHWVTDDFKKLVKHVRDMTSDLTEVDRTIFITALNIFESPILALLLVHSEITSHEFAVLYLTGLCVNSKVWSEGNREEEISGKKEIAKDAECMVRYKGLFGRRLSEIEELIQQGESKTLEFKSTLRRNLHTNKNDPRIEHAVLKTIAAFLNSEGGTLLVGVSDEGNLVDLEVDGFENEDRFQLHFNNMIKTRIGLAFTDIIKWDLVQFDQGKILRVDCLKGNRPVFMKTKDGEKFYIRTGPSTDELMAEDLINYTNQHFVKKLPQ
ncbi:MAG: ATP-binding protein [Bacteroidetes bacterium]|nr:ATP-binding protein [Bacteroidota bacterium]